MSLHTTRGRKYKIDSLTTETLYLTLCSESGISKRSSYVSQLH